MHNGNDTFLALYFNLLGTGTFLCYWSGGLNLRGRCALYKPTFEVYTKNRPAYLAAAEGSIQFDKQFEGTL